MTKFSGVAVGGIADGKMLAFDRPSMTFVESEFKGRHTGFFLEDLAQPAGNIHYHHAYYEWQQFQGRDGREGGFWAPVEHSIVDSITLLCKGHERVDTFMPPRAPTYAREVGADRMSSIQRAYEKGYEEAGMYPHVHTWLHVALLIAYTCGGVDHQNNAPKADFYRREDYDPVTFERNPDPVEGLTAEELA